MMKSLRLLLLASFVPALLAGCTRINPDEIGVRTMNFGRGKGIVALDYGAGYHRAIWPLDTWHIMPRTVQRISFLKESPMKTLDQRNQPIQFTSAGGERVLIEAEVFFRITEGQAHKVLQESGIEKRYLDVVRNLTIDTARAAFGQLKTEEFYTPSRRETIRLGAVDDLKKRLQPRGIMLIDFLVETIEFDPEYEKLIKQKKVADQRVQLEQSKAKAAEELGKVGKITVETANKVKKIEGESQSKITQSNTETDFQIAAMKAEADQYVTQRKADADRYKSEKEAEGQLLKKTAEAEGTQRMNQALAGEGGRNVAALEAAKNLMLNEITFPSVGFEWFNPVEMARRLGAEEAPEPNEAAKRSATNTQP